MSTECNDDAMTSTGTEPDLCDSDRAETAPDDDGYARKGWTWRRTLVVATVLAMTGMWIYALAMDGRIKPEGYLSDHTFSNAAEPICKAARADLAKLTPAHLAKSPEDRAAVIETATTRLTRMLDDLRAVVPDTADAKWINQWLDDWNIHIADRRDFVSRLRTKGRSQEFLETTKYGTQVSKSLNHYTEINHMESCGLPGDV